MNQFQMYSFYLEQKEAALNNMALSAETYSEMNILQSASTVSRQATSHKGKQNSISFLCLHIFFKCVDNDWRQLYDKTINNLPEAFLSE